jgi:hypothetical protein
MLNLFSGLLNSNRQAQRRAELYRELIRREAKIGGELFGPIAKNGRREFFCLDEYTWVWHEEWTDQNGQHHAVTTRYDVRPNGVLKAQDGQPYHYVTKDEAKRFLKAVQMYNKRVHAEIYD